MALARDGELPCGPSLMDLPVHLATAPGKDRVAGHGTLASYVGSTLTSRFPFLRDRFPGIVVNLPALKDWAERRNVPFEDALREVVLHEVQHGGQDVEKWKDTKPASAGGDPFERYRARTNEAEAYDAAARRDLSPQERRQVQPGALEARDRELALTRHRESMAKLRERAEIPATAPAPVGEHMLAPIDEPEDPREAYAAHHGFPDYISMHFQLLHPSTHPDVMEHHLQAAWGTPTPDSAPDDEPAP